MTARATPRLAAAFLLFAAAAAAAAPLAPAVPPAARLRAEAADAERGGRWEAAAAAYAALPAADRNDPATHARYLAAARRAAQLRRHRDPAFQQFVAALPARDAAQLFGEAVGKLAATFADPDRATPRRLWAAGVEELGRALDSPSFRARYLPAAAAEKVDEFRRSLRGEWAARPVADAREARAALKALLAAAQDQLAPPTPAALAAEVLCGACGALDEYTAFLTPEPAPDPAADLAPHGLVLGFDSDGLLVEGVAPGSWAAFHTPFRRGDRVGRVNGRSMVAGPTDLADALRVPADGFHELEPEGDGAAPVRVPVAAPTVFGGKLLPGRDGVGYLRVGEFQPATPQELADALLCLRAQGLRALVLDLRGNPGGSFLAAVEAARRFLPAGPIVTTFGQLPQLSGQAFASMSGTAAFDLPLVVLVDGETASAAEVLAAALRDNHRAELVGKPTYGKGSLQFLLRLSGPGAVRVTIARLVAPSGPLAAGVIPHVVVADPARQLDAAADRAAELLGMAPRPPLAP